MLIGQTFLQYPLNCKLEIKVKRKYCIKQTFQAAK